MQDSRPWIARQGLCLIIIFLHLLLDLGCIQCQAKVNSISWLCIKQGIMFCIKTSASGFADRNITKYHDLIRAVIGGIDQQRFGRDDGTCSSNTDTCHEYSG